MRIKLETEDENFCVVEVRKVYTTKDGEITFFDEESSEMYCVLPKLTFSDHDFIHAKGESEVQKREFSVRNKKVKDITSELLQNGFIDFSNMYEVSTRKI